MINLHGHAVIKLNATLLYVETMFATFNHMDG